MAWAGAALAQQAHLSLPEDCAKVWTISKPFAECTFHREDGTMVSISLFQMSQPVRRVARALKIKPGDLSRDVMEQLLMMTEAALSAPHNHPPDVEILRRDARPAPKSARPEGFDACIQYDFDFRLRGERSDERGLRCMKLLPSGRLLSASSSVAWQHRDQRSGRLPGFKAFAERVMSSLRMR
ncbi:MAG: hypothetical protein AAGA05_05815 [Pseudomonadota bacterium]